MDLTLDDLLQPFPRARFVARPTPIEALPNLSADLGIHLSILRDDQAGTTIGGNKSRQLEYYFGAAQATKADTILITGAVQSNFVRTAAACARRLGMRAIVQLEDRVQGMDAIYAASGNALLDRLLGADIITYPDGEDEKGADAAVRRRADEERAAGYTPYVIPLALGNPPIGALGYMRAAEEIAAHPEPFEVVVVASGSGLTHAGTLMGLHVLGHPARVFGSCVRRARPLQEARIAAVLKDLGDVLQGRVRVPDGKIRIWDGALAPGYGRLGDMARDAMERMARAEGILLDPVYTAKSFAAVPALVASGDIPKGARVLFIHTGGLAALFAYQSVLG